MPASMTSKARVGASWCANSASTAGAALTRATAAITIQKSFCALNRPLTCRLPRFLPCGSVLVLPRGLGQSRPLEEPTRLAVDS